MEKEKKIEELAEAIYKSGVAIEGTDIAFGLYDTDTHFHRMAAKLYDAGYGNVKEAVKEFAERVKGIFSGNAEERQKGYAKEIVCSLTIDEFNEEIDELIEEVRGEK